MQMQEILMAVQLLVLLTGIGAVLVRMGGRDQNLKTNTKAIEELGEIVKDLVRFQVTHETNAQHTSEVLKDIRSRLTRLETLRWGSLSEQKGL